MFLKYKQYLQYKYYYTIQNNTKNVRMLLMSKVTSLY